VNHRALLAALMALTLSTRALADPVAPLVPIPPGEDRIEPVGQGQPAPYSGQLFDNPTAIRWGHYLEQCRVRLVADVELQRKTDQAQIDFLKTSLSVREEQFKVVTSDYQRQLAEAQSPAFYRTTWFGVAVGVTGTLAVGFTTAYLLRSR